MIWVDLAQPLSTVSAYDLASLRRLVSLITLAPRPARLSGVYAEACGGLAEACALQPSWSSACAVLQGLQGHAADGCMRRLPS